MVEFQRERVGIRFQVAFLYPDKCTWQHQQAENAASVGLFAQVFEDMAHQVSSVENRARPLPTGDRAGNQDIDPRFAIDLIEQVATAGQQPNPVFHLAEHHAVRPGESEQPLRTFLYSAVVDAGAVNLVERIAQAIHNRFVSFGMLFDAGHRRAIKEEELAFRLQAHHASAAALQGVDWFIGAVESQETHVFGNNAIHLDKRCFHLCGHNPAGTAQSNDQHRQVEPDAI